MAVKSPFPGMDPYLERHWPDVHSSLGIYGRDALNDVLPEDLAARTEERIAVESDRPDEASVYKPDVRVIEVPWAQGGNAAIAEPVHASPVRLTVHVEPITERFIRIVETESERLVTVIEFVSPTNKRNPGLYEFKSKRAELLNAGVNFVEVDLVREGNWRALLHPHVCPAQLITTYRAVVRTPDNLAAADLYPIPLRQRLPVIGIPLRKKDPIVELDLQRLLDQAYRNARYAHLDYNQPADPPLDPADQEWADSLTKAVR